MKKNYKITPVFVLTLKNSLREKTLKKRLNLLNIRYKIFYAINGKEKKNFKTLDRFYNSTKAKQVIGRDMTYTEISNAEGHLRIYNYIIKKKIFNAVIMEDDCYPSKLLCDWLKLYNFFKNKNYNIIQIYHSFGLVKKIPKKIILNRFSLHIACFTIPYTTCYQITKKTCQYIVARNKKIFRLVDWPINFHNSKIKQYVVLPYIVMLRHDHAETSYQTYLWKKFNILKRIKKSIYFYNLITTLYFLLHIPFFLRIYKDYCYYKELFLLRKFFYIRNFFSSNYINLEKTLVNKKFYPDDLVNNAKKSLLFNS
jgi:GR25 family glycosyltransferase involved in LPS biosynthesis